MLLYPSWYIRSPINDYIDKALETGEPFSWFFVGATGCGKTYLANLIFEYLRATEDIKSDIFISAPEIYREYMDALDDMPRERSYKLGKIEKYMCRPLVVIDDLGAEKNTEAAHALIGDLIRAQYDYYQEGKSNKCIITTNYSEEALLEMYGEPVIDRLKPYVVLRFTSGSYRRAGEVIKG